MRYLRRSYQFITDKEPGEVERQAERYFGALGYKRRDDAGASSSSGSSGSMVFTRGRRLASLYSAAFRACEARVTVEYRPGRLTVRHKVEVLGRLLANADAPLLDAEARGFQSYLDGEGVAWDRGFLERGRRRAWRMRAARAAILATYTAAVVALVWWWLRRPGP